MAQLASGDFGAYSANESAALDQSRQRDRSWLRYLFSSEIRITFMFARVTFQT